MSAINTTNLDFSCLLCLFANYNDLFWLWIWPACFWSDVHIIQQFHEPKKRVDSKTNCSTTLSGTASPFLWDPGCHTTAGVACWRSLAPKRPATDQKNWTPLRLGGSGIIYLPHIIRQPDLEWLSPWCGVSPCSSSTNKEAVAHQVTAEMWKCNDYYRNISGSSSGTSTSSRPMSKTRTRREHANP